jgi:hypothetical protein
MQDSAILMKTAQVFAPDVFQSLKEAGSIGERLGGTASTIFYCNNYTAPLHGDRDSTPGLCTQLDLNADHEKYEYAFINMAYRCYFVARANTFW